MAVKNTFCYPSASSGHSIYAVEWIPEQTPIGVVQIVHGIAEHVGRYEEVAQFLCAHGFLVCGEDHLGHGHTVENGKYGFFAPKNGWNLVVQDIHTLQQQQSHAYPSLPYFLLGHSMGSFLVRTYLIQYPGVVSGAILSGTGQESSKLVALGKSLASLECKRLGVHGVSPLISSLSLGGYNRKFHPNRTTADWISSDPSEVDRYLSDPLCQYPITASLFRDMMGGLQLIGNPKALSKMDKHTPVYFFSGDHDPVGGMGKGVQKVVQLFRQAGCTDVTLHLYPGGRHEMFHEANKQEVLTHLLRWLEAHV